MKQGVPASKQGYTLVELVLVMLLLALFGVTIMTLIQSGTTAYGKIVDNRNAESDARIAINYLDVRVRQNDERGAVEVRPNPLGEGNALVIRERYGEETYYTWVYFLDGTLYECSLLLEDESVSVGRSAAIARLEDFRFEMRDGHVLHQSAEYMYTTAQDKEVRSLSSVIVLRSEVGAS